MISDDKEGYVINIDEFLSNSENFTRLQNLPSVKSIKSRVNNFSFQMTYGVIGECFFWRNERERERAIYWVWMKIIASINSHDFLTNNDRLLNERNEVTKHDCEKLKDKYQSVILEMKSSNEREDVIQSFLLDLSSNNREELVNGIAYSLKYIWERQVRIFQRINWLSKTNKDELIWAFNYLNKKGLIPDFYNECHFYYEVNELRMAVIGAIDFYSPLGDERDIDVKLIFIEKMKKAFLKNKRNSNLVKSIEKITLSAEISIEAKDALDFMSKKDKIPKNKILDNLLLSALKAYK